MFTLHTEVAQIPNFLPPSDSDQTFSLNQIRCFHIKSGPLAYVVLQLIYIQTLAMQLLSEKSDWISCGFLNISLLCAYCLQSSLSVGSSQLVKVNMEESNNSSVGQRRDEEVSDLLDINGDASP